MDMEKIGQLKTGLELQSKIAAELKGYTFEPPNHVIQNLTSDLSSMNFVSSRARPCVAEKIYGEEL